MAWVRIDDGIFRNRKIQAVGHEAFCLWLAACSYAGRELTDGALTARAVKIAAAEANADAGLCAELVGAGLWEPCKGTRDHPDAIYLIHDFLVYNPSRQEVLTERRKTAERVAEHRARRASDDQTVQAATGNGVTNSSSNTRPVPVPVPVPDPRPVTRFPTRPKPAATAPPGRSPAVAVWTQETGKALSPHQREVIERYEAHLAEKGEGTELIEMVQHAAAAMDGNRSPFGLLQWCMTEHAAGRPWRRGEYRRRYSEIRPKDAETDAREQFVIWFNDLDDEAAHDHVAGMEARGEPVPAFMRWRVPASASA